MHFQAECDTVWILIRWLRKKPADLYLQCVFFLKKTNPGVKALNYKQIKKNIIYLVIKNVCLCLLLSVVYIIHNASTPYMTVSMKIIYKK